MNQRLVAQGLHKSYGGRKVVCGVDLEVASGEVVGLLGPNGAGKTTSFYMVVGLVRPDKGSIFLDGKELTDLPMYQRARVGIAYLAQEASVFRKMTVQQNLLAVLETMGLGASVCRQRMDELLEDFHLGHVAKSFGYALSGGERRRLEIARALVVNPAFILLDEPFAGIDPIAVIDIQNIMATLRQRGIGILVSDHNVRETLGVCDRAYILNAGETLASGLPQDIAACPKVRSIYLGEKFKL